MDKRDPWQDPRLSFPISADGFCFVLEDTEVSVRFMQTPYEDPINQARAEELARLILAAMEGQAC